MNKKELESKIDKFSEREFRKLVWYLFYRFDENEEIYKIIEKKVDEYLKK